MNGISRQRISTYIGASCLMTALSFPAGVSIAMGATPSQTSAVAQDDSGGSDQSGNDQGSSQSNSNQSDTEHQGNSQSDSSQSDTEHQGNSQSDSSQSDTERQGNSQSDNHEDRPTKGDCAKSGGDWKDGVCFYKLHTEDNGTDEVSRRRDPAQRVTLQQVLADIQKRTAELLKNASETPQRVHIFACSQADMWKERFPQLPALLNC
ncbi:hypothetical protein [Streptomyces sp. MJM1172]|uniref:hypothetical protein n=1 Tax=Streptomyces sp. MJM1172 TaxID=1703926 RepID=UPI00093F6397|nr:hypothetical protein [Streptomyces sp. MJM1172]OKI52638.1 hypothetical protein AMK15_29960 [Streptomyces sp. MJM1172]